MSCHTQAANAIATLNEVELSGRRIHVREDRVDSAAAAPASGGGRGGGGGRGRCYVGNLAYGVEWQDLKDAFRACGKVVHADVVKDDTGEIVWRNVEVEV